MTLNGIDISAYQRGIDVSANGVPADFVGIKATEGIGYVNTDCDRAFQQAKAAGRRRLVYHFANQNDAIAEADFFLSKTAGYRDGHTIPVLDVEAAALNNSGAWVRAWLDRVASVWGTKPLVYMSGSPAKNSKYDIVVQGNYGLWVAAYPSPAPTTYTDVPDYVPTRWPFSAMRQYSSSGRLPGYNGPLDLNIFYGDLAAFDKYAAIGGNVVPGPTPTPPTPTPPKPSGGLKVDGIMGSATITDLQKKLAAKGYYSGKIDGVIDSGTSLTVSGLQRYLNDKDRAGLVVDGRGLWQNGLKSNTNRALQVHVHAPVHDGIFDVPVSNGIKSFQTALNNGSF